MATRLVLTPLAAEFPASAFPQLQLVNRRSVLSFDASTQETCYWTGIAPQGLTGTLTAIIHYIMASATTGGVVFEGAIEAVTDADATDLDAGDSFDTYNTSSTETVPGTAGHKGEIAITLTTQDSIAAGDYFRLALRRAPANAGDDAVGDASVLAVELRDGA
jgi:hypothetical protein